MTPNEIVASVRRYLAATGGACPDCDAHLKITSQAFGIDRVTGVEVLHDETCPVLRGVIR